MAAALTKFTIVEAPLLASTVSLLAPEPLVKALSDS